MDKLNNLLGTLDPMLKTLNEHLGNSKDLSVFLFGERLGFLKNTSIEAKQHKKITDLLTNDANKGYGLFLKGQQDTMSRTFSCELDTKNEEAKEALVEFLKSQNQPSDFIS